jgi:hypothetical protein
MIEAPELLRRIGHEHRFEAMVAMRPLVENPITYWKMMNLAWTTAELISPHTFAVEELFGHHVECRAAFMGLADRRALAALPETIKVWRGTSFPSQDGWSWSLNRESAEWFGRRWPISGEAYLIEGEVERANVIAYLGDRGEAEIVVSQDHVSVLNVHDLDISDLDPQWQISYLARTGQLGIDDMPIPLEAKYEASYRQFIAELRHWNLTDLADKHEKRIEASLAIGRDLARR